MDNPKQYTPAPWIDLGRVSNDDSRTLIGNKDANVALVGCANPLIQQANANLISAAHELLAYAECEEAKRLSLIPTDKGGAGNAQSYFETFTKHGWDGRDVFGFLDRLREVALKKARG